MSHAMKPFLPVWGSLAQLARDLGISRAAVAQWKRVPAERVVAVERFTGIPREELRPDLYAPQEARNENAA